MNITQLACTRVQKLTPYQSARRIGGNGRIYLNANESPVSLHFDLDSSGYNRYPECQPEEILQAYASYAGVTPDQVLVARGSDEVIGLLVRTFCEPGKEQILICPPTYGMYAIAAETNGIDTIKVAPDDNFQPDIPAIFKALDENSVKLVFFCSPNNPTGTIIREDLLKQVLDKTRGGALVVVDEAYIEFSPENSMIHLLKEYPNLIITRTLSKAFALAGLRCGFALADPEIISLLLKVIDPYPICAPVAQVATSALSGTNVDIMRKRVEKLNTIRNKFVSECRKLNIVSEVFDTNGNYVLLRFKDGEKVFAGAKEKGCILRDFNDKPRLDNCVRVTVGTQDEMTEVLNILKGLC